MDERTSLGIDSDYDPGRARRGVSGPTECRGGRTHEAGPADRRVGAVGGTPAHSKQEIGLGPWHDLGRCGDAFQRHFGGQEVCRKTVAAQAEAVILDATIAANLKEFGYGS